MEEVVVAAVERRLAAQLDLVHGQLAVETCPLVDRLVLLVDESEAGLRRGICLWHGLELDRSSRKVIAEFLASG